jgi:hypothetical protein
VTPSRILYWHTYWHSRCAGLATLVGPARAGRSLAKNAIKDLATTIGLASVSRR